MSGYDEYYSAMNNRISGMRKIYVGNEEGLITLKHWLNDHLDGSETGGVASFIASSPYGLKILPAESPHAGKMVMVAWEGRAEHGMTIVGYNDSIRFDYNQDGQYTNNKDINGDGIIDMKDWEIGALKFANSHGSNFANDGYCFMMYRTLAADFDNGGIWMNTVHILDAKEEHDTRMTYKISLEHDYRERIRVQAGISSDLGSNKPDHIHSYTIFNYQGGWHYMQGNDTSPDRKTIEFGLDITPLLSYVESGQSYKFFLIIDERDDENMGTGQLKYFSLMDYTNGLNEIACEQENVPLVENGRSYFTVIHSPTFDDLTINTEELPLYEAGQAMQVQMNVSGGQQPYSWLLDKNYNINITAEEFPELGEHLIMTSSLSDSLVVQALDFSFPFYGNSYDSVLVSASGYVSFDENMYFWSYLVDMAYFLKHNRVVAPFMCPEMIVFDDLDNGIWYEGDENSASFRWRTTHLDYLASSEFNFALTLYPNGNIDFYYGDIDVNGEIRSVSGIADGDYVNHSVADMPLAHKIHPGTKIKFLAPQIPNEISISKDGMLEVLENSEAVIKDISVIVTDNTLLSTAKTFKLTEDLEISLEVDGSSQNQLLNGRVSSMNLIIKNRGSSPMSGIDIILHNDHPMVSLPDSQHHIDNLNAGETLEVAGAFCIHTDTDMLDKQAVILDLECISGTKIYNITQILQTSSPFIELQEYTIQTESGILEPGETSMFEIQLVNKGSGISINTVGILSSNHPGINISEPQMDFESILPGTISSAEISVNADYSISFGEEVIFTLNLIDELGLSHDLSFDLRVGKVPVCVINLDPDNNSAHNIFYLLQEMDIECEYTASLPYSLNEYQSIFLSLGQQLSFYEISYVESVALEQYLNQGGNIYLESRMNWQDEQRFHIFDRFNIDTESIPGLYEVLDGVDSTFTEGLAYSNIASQPVCFFRLMPISPAFSILTGREYPYCAAVAYDAGTYKTIGTIFELGSLMSSDTCEVETYIQEVLDFFGIVKNALDIEEIPAGERISAVQNFPNPFSHSTKIPIRLEQRSFVEAAVYDLQGRKVYQLHPAGELNAGQYHLNWDGRSHKGTEVPGGIYIYRILLDGVPYTGKMILIR